MKRGKFWWVKAVVWMVELVFIVSLVGSIFNLWKKKDIVRERRNVLSQVEAENERLKQKLSEAQSQTFIEREARDKLGLVKPGEIIVLVGQATSGSNLAGPREAELSNWKQWWKLFF